MKKFISICLLSSFIFFSCTHEPVVKVTRIGQLEDLIKKGDMKTHAKMSDYASSPHLYAIGSVTNLKGFIQVVDSKPYNCSVENGQLKMDSSFNVDATLFMYANVEEWKEFDLPAEVKTWKQLEQFIGNQATKYKIPKKAVSPFLLKGTAENVQWHVVDWDTADKKITYRKTIESGMHGEMKDEYITGVGFFSRESYEVLAHKETNIHIHFVNRNHSIAGHLDDIILDGRMKLYLPKLVERNEKEGQ